MRNTKQLDFEGTVGKLTVSELRVRDIRKLVSHFKSMGDVDIASLFGDDFDQVASLLDGCIEFKSASVDIDDLSFGEAEAIFEAFQEVNPAFFKRLAALGLGLSVLPAAPETSTAAAPS